MKPHDFVSVPSGVVPLSRGSSRSFLHPLCYLNSAFLQAWVLFFSLDRLFGMIPRAVPNLIVSINMDSTYTHTHIHTHGKQGRDWFYTHIKTNRCSVRLKNKKRKKTTKCFAHLNSSSVVCMNYVKMVRSEHKHSAVLLFSSAWEKKLKYLLENSI